MEAATYVDIDDETYQILSRLEAEGVIKSGPLTTKPISRKEVIRLLYEAVAKSHERSEYIKGLVRSLRQRIAPDDNETRKIRPVDAVYARFVRTDSDVLSLDYNNNGDEYARGGNYRAGLFSRFEDIGPFSIFLNPEYRSSAGDDEIVINKGYGVLDFGWDLILGKDSMWWGPGYHGAILITDNAEPFTMFKITNPEPVVLPWYFRYLGPLRLTFFVAQLEKERNDHPRPIFWGMRVDFKPHQYLTLGLERTALMGGRGRPADISTVGRSIFGLRENIPDRQAGDQRAGYDITLIIPNKYQPVQAYFEADGEDKRGGMPFKWAILTGGYFPGLFGIEPLSFRAEYACTHVYGGPENADTWYRHGVYTDGYTYYDRIIGHHLGTDSRDRYFELTYTMPDSYMRVSVAYDFETHDHSDTKPGQEKKRETTLKIISRIVEGLEGQVSYSRGRIYDLGNEPRDAVELNKIEGGVRYVF